MKRRTALAIRAVLAFAVGCGAAGAQTPASAPASRPATTTLDLRLNPLIDLHYVLRARARAQVPEPSPLTSAAETVRQIEDQLGGSLAWGLLEGPLASYDSAAEARRRLSELPKVFTMRDGRSLPVRDLAVRLAEALLQAEPEFLSEMWPRHRQQLERARLEISEELLPRQGECLGLILEHLRMADPGEAIPVFLVVEAPEPGAFTHRRRGGGGVCFVGLGSAAGTQLYETILHESIHALDIASEGQDTVLQEVRRRLRDAGLTPADRMLRDVPHTLMFVEAGEAVRQCLDPAHRHYGDVHGYYPKVSRATGAVRPNWEAHLRGELTRESAIQRIVEAAVQSE